MATAPAKDKVDKRNVYQRLAAAMGDLHYLQNDSQAPKAAGGYRYTSHDAVTSAVRSVLLKQGLVWWTGAGSDTGWDSSNGHHVFSTFLFRVINIDAPEEYIEFTLPGAGQDSHDPAKAVGKMISYIKKYAMQLITLLPTGDDPDADAPPEKPAEPAGKDDVRDWIGEMGLRAAFVPELIAQYYPGLGNKPKWADMSEVQAKNIHDAVQKKHQLFTELAKDSGGKGALALTLATACLDRNGHENILLAPEAHWRAWTDKETDDGS